MGKDITFFVSKISYSSKRIIDLNCTIVPFSKKVLSFLVKSTIVFGEKYYRFHQKVALILMKKSLFLAEKYHIFIR